MAAITSAGIGSGLDVAGLVQQLVSAERAPAEQRLLRAQSGVQLKISGLGALRSALAEFKSTVDTLKTGNAIGALRASSSKPELFTASAATGAVVGSYDIEVLALARAHKLVSGSYASAGASVGVGPVTIGVGSKSFTVTLAEGADSLADLRDAINGASDNAGVSATLLSESGGARLLLTARDTGTASALSVTGIATTERQAARDASIRVEGYAYSSASNTVTGAIEGVTLTLLAEGPGTIAQLGVAQDPTSARTAVDNFVRSYNKLATTIAQLTRYDPVARTGGPLIGDAAVRGLSDHVRRLLGSEAGDAGEYRVLSQLGIALQADGSLKLDATKLGEALSRNSTSVQKLFSGSTGIATQLSSTLESYLADDGSLDAKNDALRARLEDIGDQRLDLDRRMAVLRQRYLAQFTALDNAISQMRSSSDYLTRQLANLPGFSSER